MSNTAHLHRNRKASMIFVQSIASKTYILITDRDSMVCGVSLVYPFACLGGEGSCMTGVCISCIITHGHLTGDVCGYFII